MFSIYRMEKLTGQKSKTFGKNYLTNDKKEIYFRLALILLKLT